MDKLPNLTERLMPVIKTVPQQPQTQVSLNEQLVALTVIATRFGLYDAADYLRLAGSLNKGVS